MFKIKIHPLFLFTFFFIQCSSQNIQLTKVQLNNPDFILNKGRQFYMNKDYDLAIQMFHLLLKRFPERNYNASWALYEIGMSHYIQKDYPKAREYFIKILKTYLIPKQPRTLALHLIRKIDQQNAHKHSTYTDD